MKGRQHYEEAEIVSRSTKEIGTHTPSNVYDNGNLRVGYEYGEQLRERVWSRTAHALDLEAISSPQFQGGGGRQPCRGCKEAATLLCQDLSTSLRYVVANVHSCNNMKRYIRGYKLQNDKSGIEEWYVRRWVDRELEGWSVRRERENGRTARGRDSMRRDICGGTRVWEGGTSTRESIIRLDGRMGGGRVDNRVAVREGGRDVEASWDVDACLEGWEVDGLQTGAKRWRKVLRFMRRRYVLGRAPMTLPGSINKLSYIRRRIAITPSTLTTVADVDHIANHHSVDNIPSERNPLPTLPWAWLRAQNGHKLGRFALGKVQNNLVERNREVIETGMVVVERLGAVDLSS
ncbi:hypothetical protein IW262DRAFT_1298147 [Armillaria fumosa]|nr:hypothetical protein IW262DRAFT_1298147 [Armillaria fumosa]